LRERGGAVIWGAGPVGKAASRALLAAGTPVLAFVEVDPRKIGQDIHGAPVVAAEEGAAMEGVLHLAAVGQPGARERIRGLLRDAGRKELEDFVAIA
jgi:threonine dehydrogenase-like Zn-dependent dehydrogenase